MRRQTTVGYPSLVDRTSLSPMSRIRTYEFNDYLNKSNQKHNLQRKEWIDPSMTIQKRSCQSDLRAHQLSANLTTLTLITCSITEQLILMKSSNCLELNEQAKKLFKSSKQQKHRSLIVGDLKRAIQMSESALPDCGRDLLPKVHKNLSIYHQSLLEQECGSLQILEKSITHRMLSIIKGHNQPEMTDKLFVLLQDNEGWLTSLDRDARIHFYCRLKNITLNQKDLLQFRLHLQVVLAKVLFMKALLLEENELKFKDALFEYEFILENLREVQYKKGSLDLQFLADVTKHFRRCSILSEYVQLLQWKIRVIDLSDTVFNDLFDIIDKLRFVAEQAQGMDQEIVCKALFEIGSIYFTVLRDDERASKEFARVIQKGTNTDLISPEMRNSGQWFVKSQKHLLAIHKERADALAEEEKKSQQAILLKYKDAFDEVLSIFNKKKDFKLTLLFIQDKFPHTRTKITGVEDDAKIFRQFSRIYHPDQNIKEKVEWKVVCRKLTSMVNQFKASNDKK